MTYIKKILTNNIGIISLIASSIALIINMIRFIPNESINSIPKWALKLFGIISPYVDISFMSIFKFSIINIVTHQYVSYAAPIFYIIMIVGSIIYISSHGLNKRLLTFCYTIVIYSTIAIQFYWFYRFRKLETIELVHIKSLLFGLTACAIWVTISYVFINYLIGGDRNIKGNDLKLTRNNQRRFVFLRWIVDVIIAVLFASGPLGVYVINFSLDSFLGKYTVHFYIFLLLFIYVLFFKVLFNITPGQIILGGTKISKNKI
jgi:hypothetical protein